MISSAGCCIQDSSDRWYMTVVIPLVSFLAGLLLIVPCRVMWYCCYALDDHAGSESRRETATWSCFSRIRAWAVAVSTAQNHLGKIVMICVFLCNLASIVLYLLDATHITVSSCSKVRTEPTQMFYLALNCVFFIHLVLRFIAAPDKLFMWIDIYSIVDHMTIGSFVWAWYVDVNWIGIRFLRLLYLLQLSEVLQILHVLRDAKSIRLTQIITIFASIWFTCAGFAQLIEDNAHMTPGKEESDRAILGYWESVYWLLVTMSTVGFGEISPQTNIGRAFMVIYIVGTFAMFTAIVPELVAHVGKSSKYLKPYKRVYGKKHVIVCGHINYDTISRFIRDFHHEDADNKHTNVCFIHSGSPDLKMEAFFKRHYSNICFVEGSSMDIPTLKKAKLVECSAVLILANRNTADGDEEDGTNIMRATAIKNYHGSTRVIIQLLHYHNKTYLLHIPNWNWGQTNGDDVICIAELKLGLLAQNCMAPGICCLMSNLFTMSSYKQSHNKKSKSISWMEDYQYGAGNEIYIQTFSSAFNGLSFAQAAEICFTELNILLLAIQCDGARSGRISVNPTSGAAISDGYRGFFIAQGPEDVSKVNKYNPSKGGFVGRDKNFNDINGTIPMKAATGVLHCEKEENNNQSNSTQEAIGLQMSVYRHRRPSMDVLATAAHPERHVEMLDYTGMFHWCHTRTLQEATLDYEKISKLHLKEHVVVCMLSDENSSSMGLTNFVMPLRTSNFKLEQLKGIVLLGSPAYIAKEWDALSNFPNIYVYDGSADNRLDLRCVQVEHCSMCVILSAKKLLQVDTTMLDNNTILTNLNVQGMFGKSTEAKIRTLGISPPEDADAAKTAPVCSDIPITVELEVESNVAYLDQDDDDDADIPLYMTHPYVSGAALASSCLDSLVAATFSNSHILTIVRALITGNETTELERVLAEGLGIVRKHSPQESEVDKTRCRLALIPVGHGVLREVQDVRTYGDLFAQALRNHSVLCIGLYRLMSAQDPTQRQGKRFVITNPSADFLVIASDKVYILQPQRSDQDADPVSRKEHVIARGSSLSKEHVRGSSLSTAQEEKQEPTQATIYTHSPQSQFTKAVRL